MIVIDASAIVELLLQTSASGRIRERIFRPEETLHAPELLDVEVLQVLRRYSRARVLTAARAAEALVDLQDLTIHRYSHRDLASRIWQLRENLTAYDAAYVALAEGLAAPLLTRDRSIAAAPRHRAAVELV